MGFSLKKFVRMAAPVAVGALTGGTGGALMAALSSGGSALAGSDLVSGAVGLGLDHLNAQSQFDYSKKASDYAFDKNLQMWNLNNAYNDPSAQAERLERAGLNRNLLYGSGNVSGNTSGSTPSYDTPKVSYENKQLQREQLRLALAEHGQRITNQAIENDLARQRLVLAEREADRSDRLANAQIMAYQANLGQIDANIDNMSYTREQKRKDFAYKQYQADLNAWQQRYNQNYNKFAARLNEAKEIRRVMAIVGRRPMLIDYLNY